MQPIPARRAGRNPRKELTVPVRSNPGLRTKKIVVGRAWSVVGCFGPTTIDYDCDRCCGNSNTQDRQIRARFPSQIELPCPASYLILGIWLDSDRLDFRSARAFLFVELVFHPLLPVRQILA